MNAQVQKNQKITIDVEFIELCRSLRDAQKTASHSQREQRRARSLEQLFDAKLKKIEEHIASLLPPDAEPTGDVRLFGGD